MRPRVEATLRRGAGTIPWQLNEPFPNAWCTCAVDYRGAGTVEPVSARDLEDAIVELRAGIPMLRATEMKIWAKSWHTPTLFFQTSTSGVLFSVTPDL